MEVDGFCQRLDDVSSEGEPDLGISILKMFELMVQSRAERLRLRRHKAANWQAYPAPSLRRCRTSRRAQPRPPRHKRLAPAAFYPP